MILASVPVAPSMAGAAALESAEVAAFGRIRCALYLELLHLAARVLEQYRDHRGWTEARERRVPPARP
jgi:hypothetical protein